MKPKRLPRLWCAMQGLLPFGLARPDPPAGDGLVYPPARDPFAAGHAATFAPARSSAEPRGDHGPGRAPEARQF